METSAASARVLAFPSLPALREVATRLSGSFTVHMASPGETAIRLREREADAGLLSPIDFARDSSDYMLLRGVGLAAAQPRGPVTIFFRRGVSRVASLAVDPSFSSEIVLASILLAEEFEGAPAIVPVPGPPDFMLNKADAALVVGPTPTGIAHGGTLDLIEAWAELTELPFVYGLWCARENTLTAADRSLIRNLHLGVAPCGPEFTHQLGSGAEQGLQELFRFAFYHGILPDIPDFRWFEDFDGAEEIGTPN